MHLIRAPRFFTTATVALLLVATFGCASRSGAIHPESSGSDTTKPATKGSGEPQAADARARTVNAAGRRPQGGTPRPTPLEEIPDGDAEERAQLQAGDEEDAEIPDGDAAADEEDARPPMVQTIPGVRYTHDLSDAHLATTWRNNPGLLGAISVGFVDEGRLINGQPFPETSAWKVVKPGAAWATEETIAYLAAAISRVKALRPDAPPLRVNAISVQHGGYLPPHKSHQSGRDVDLGFYYPTAEPIRAVARERYIDVALNWELIKSLVLLTDVQMILVDRRVKKVLYRHALRSGEDKAWLDSLFYAGRKSLIRHARRHRDHFHVRFYNPRAQELGRRIAPLLAKRADRNIVTHRVRSGDTLGAIAAKYGTTIGAVKKTNGMRRSFLRVGQVLKVRLRGPCTRCPVPPPVVVPQRRLPPVQIFAAAPMGASR